MKRERYYNRIYRILVKLWGQEPTISDRLIIMNYAGNLLARSLSFRKRLVLFLIEQHLKDIKRKTID